MPFKVLRGRRALLYPNLWKPVPLTTMWTTNGSLGLPSRRLEATRLAHVRGKATSVMLARIPSNEFQIKNEEEQVEIKFNSDEYYQSNHIISLLPQIVLVLANFYFVSSFLLKVETRTPFIKRYLSPGLKSVSI